MTTVDNPAQPSSPARGVYFLSSDSTLEIAIAFLNSFREHNPRLPLCLIPFDASSHGLRQLAREYDFSTFDDAGLLERCDRISRRFHSSTVGHYRKLAMWEGPFDEFIYIDIDTVVLHSLNFVFGLLPGHAFLTSHSHIGDIVKWVWKRSARRAAELDDVAIAFSASTGFIASRRGPLTLDVAEAKLKDALRLAGHMVLLCKEQPFLNYLIVTSGQIYSSLFVIECSQRYGTAVQDIPLELWAGTRGRVFHDRRCHPGPQPLLVHWAGLWQPTTMDSYRSNLARLFNRPQNSVDVSVRRRLRHRGLWTHYRYLRSRRSHVL